MLDPTEWFIIVPDMFSNGNARASIHNRVFLTGLLRILEAELPHLKHGRLAPIPSIGGHRAGSPEGIAAELELIVKAQLEGADLVTSLLEERRRDSLAEDQK